MRSGAFEDFAEKWGKAYPAMIRLWRSAWAEFVPFLDYGACRRMTCPGTGGDEGSGRIGHGSELSSCAA